MISFTTTATPTATAATPIATTARAVYHKKNTVTSNNLSNLIGEYLYSIWQGFCKTLLILHGLSEIFWRTDMLAIMD